MGGSECTCTVGKLSACALGLAAGITWALAVFIIGVLAATLDVGGAWVALLASVYVGYSVSVLGIIVGTVWGFVDGFICGFLVAFFYNFCLKHCVCKFCKPKEGAGEVKSEK